MKIKMSFLDRLFLFRMFINIAIKAFTAPQVPLMLFNDHAEAIKSRQKARRDVLPEIKQYGAIEPTLIIG